MGYRLDDPSFVRLLQMATDRNLVVQLAVRMEDKRTQHPLVVAPPVELAALEAVVRNVPRLRLVLLNAWPHLPVPLMLKLVAAAEVYVEIATLENVGGIANLLNKFPRNGYFLDRMLHFSFLNQHGSS